MPWQSQRSIGEIRGAPRIAPPRRPLGSNTFSHRTSRGATRGPSVVPPLAGRRRDERFRADHSAAVVYPHTVLPMHRTLVLVVCAALVGPRASAQTPVDSALASYINGI